MSLRIGGWCRSGIELCGEGRAHLGEGRAGGLGLVGRAGVEAVLELGVLAHQAVDGAGVVVDAHGVDLVGLGPAAGRLQPGCKLLVVEGELVANAVAGEVGKRLARGVGEEADVEQPQLQVASVVLVVRRGLEGARGSLEQRAELRLRRVLRRGVRVQRPLDVAVVDIERVVRVVGLRELLVELAALLAVSVAQLRR